MNRIQFIYIICVSAMRINANFLTKRQFGRAIRFIERYNDLEIKAVMTVVSPQQSDSNTFLIEDVLKDDQYAKYPLYISFCVTSQNSSIMIDKLLDLSLPTVITLEGFESNVEIFNFISDFPRVALTQHSWLVYLNSIFDNQTDLHNKLTDIFYASERNPYVEHHFCIKRNITNVYGH